MGATSGGPQRVAHERETSLSPAEDAAFSQRFHFRPYETAGGAEYDDGEGASSAQPFLQEDGARRNTRMVDRLGYARTASVLVMYAVHWLLARWKAFVVIGSVGSIASLLLFNLSSPEWRERAYYR